MSNLKFNVREDLLECSKRVLANTTVEECDAIDAEIAKVTSSGESFIARYLVETAAFTPNDAINRAVAWGYLAGKMAQWKEAQEVVNTLSVTAQELAEYLENALPHIPTEKKADMITTLVKTVDALAELEWVPFKNPFQNPLGEILEALKEAGFDVTVETVGKVE